jgi:hypothetical protein
MPTTAAPPQQLFPTHLSIKLVAAMTCVEGPFWVPKLFSFAGNFLLETLAKNNVVTRHKTQETVNAHTQKEYHCHFFVPARTLIVVKLLMSNGGCQPQP